MATAELDRKGWLAERQGGIGASEWSAALGIHPKVSRFELAALKRGTIEAVDLDDQEDVEFGRALEPVCLAFLGKRTGRHVRPWTQTEIIRSEEHDFLFCTPDAFQTDKERGRGVAEAKNRSQWVAGDWKDKPPLLIQVQLQAQMAVTGCEWGTICVIIGGNRFAWFDVDRNDQFIKAAIPILRQFWELVQTGQEMPATDSSASCKAAVGKLYPLDNGQEIALPETFAEKFAELTAIKQCQKALEKRRDEIENGVKFALGDATRGTLANGASFTWKSQVHRKPLHCPHCQGLVTAGSDCRVLRQHEPKGGLDVTATTLLAYATAALMTRGALIRHESESGSRYFELPGGLQVRISDHAPNEATEAWIGRNEVASIRTDQPGWREQLEAVTGPLLIAE